MNGISICWLGALRLEKNWQQQQQRRVSCVFHDDAFNAPIISIVSAGSHWIVRRASNLQF
jgi:hypothetical protein